MKKHLNHIFMLAALLMAGVAVASCEKENEPVEGTFAMSVNAVKGGNGTKQLDFEGSELTATWTAGDVVKVFKDYYQVGTLTAESSGTSTRLSGTITGSIAEGDNLTLRFLSADYDGQDGTLAYIAAHCDYAVAHVTVSSVSGDEVRITGSSATFENQQAIVKFTLKNSSGDAINASFLRVSDDGFTTCTVTPAAATDELYVALPGFSNRTVSLEASIAGMLYTYSKSPVTLANGQYYEIGVKMAAVPGTLAGRFDIGAQQVHFSQGNLQATYDYPSEWNWHFATNQWDHIGFGGANQEINGNGTVENYGTVDLFGWVGASSSLTGTAQYGISNSTTASTYGTVDDEALKSDWGNTIGSGWRTMTWDEWDFLLNSRGGGSSVNGTHHARYTQATINTDATGVNGLILFPDGVTIGADEATSWGAINGTSDWGTRCTSAQWAALAAKGCVFLPVTGHRDEYSVDYSEEQGYYWSATPYSTDQAFCLHFYSNHASPEAEYRFYGCAVRLVRAAD